MITYIYDLFMITSTVAVAENIWALHKQPNK